MSKIALLIFAVKSLSAFAAAPASPIKALRVGCPNISVVSLESSIAFFTKVLDFKLANQEDKSPILRFAPGLSQETKARSAHLNLGDECIELTEYSSPKGLPFPTDSSGNDKWFQHIAIVVSDMDKAFARLREVHVRLVSNMPQVLPASNKPAAGISALYFRDPDGHYLELIHYPADKGQAKWQTHSAALFLGIDHTAMTVSNTAQSLSFYRDKLHLHVAGGSENFGPEQEHLNGVPHAHVLITALRAESGIGIELLDYLSPTGGRAIPESLRPNDIASWQIPIEVEVAKTNTAINDLSWHKLPSKFKTSTEAAWMKDPDGHLLKLEKH